MAMKHCIENNCSKPYVARGYCDSHYRQHKKAGDLLTSTQERRPAIIKGNTAKIPVGLNAKDGYAIVDKDKAAEIEKYLWCDHRGYALTRITVSRGNYKNVPMHHFIVGKPIDGKEIDHKNRNRRDNRAANLRMVTHKVNSRNSGMFKHNTSGYRGVAWDKSRNNWQARIKIAGKEIYLGRFNTKEQAHKARKDYENSIQFSRTSD